MEVDNSTPSADTRLGATDSLSSRDYYFDSYAHFGIHEEMLKDEVRTLAYRNAIYRNRALFADKIVLDVGCGTGILSMFAATAGAKLVIGVDMSNIIDQARLIVEENQLSDKIVLLKGKMEEIQLPQGIEKVDIIISEWMGYFLLYESMLDTVLYARDCYLKPDGFLFPDKASMLICGIEDAEYKEKKIDFWENVYGFKMRTIQKLALHEPLVDIVEGKAVVTSTFVFKEIDIKTVTKADLSFTTSFEIVANSTEYMHALVAYFNVSFSAGHKSVDFGTGPYDRHTHWKQTVFYLPEDLSVTEGDRIRGLLTCKPNGRNPRDLDITVDYSHYDASENTIKAGPFNMDYKMC